LDECRRFCASDRPSGGSPNSQKNWRAGWPTAGCWPGIVVGRFDELLTEVPLVGSTKRHTTLLVGPPGAGMSMLAVRLPSASRSSCLPLKRCVTLGRARSDASHRLIVPHERAGHRRPFLFCPERYAARFAFTVRRYCTVILSISRQSRPRSMWLCSSSGSSTPNTCGVEPSRYVTSTIQRSIAVTLC